MVRTVTYEEARAMLTGLAAEFPDRQVERCTYTFDDGEPNCIIGVALARWQVPTVVLVAMDERRFDLTLPQLNPYLTFDRDAVNLLQAAQLAQDERVGGDQEDDTALFTPWSKAVVEALAQVEGRFP